MTKEPATWNSYSGSLSKIKNENLFHQLEDEVFLPSKMSFFSLIKHSLSIISCI